MQNRSALILAAPLVWLLGLAWGGPAAKPRTPLATSSSALGQKVKIQGQVLSPRELALNSRVFVNVSSDSGTMTLLSQPLISYKTFELTSDTSWADTVR